MKIIITIIIVTFCSKLVAQNEPYIGGIGRGDSQISIFNQIISDSIYRKMFFGGIGRGDISESYEGNMGRQI